MSIQTWVSVGLCGVVLVSGCATRGPELGVAEEPRVRPGMILVTPDQAEKHGLLVKEDRVGSGVPAEARPDSSAVLAPAQVKVYSMGRYADPADPDLLHEAHLVYRREAGARWNMEPGPAGQVLVGPRVVAADPNAGPIKNQELEGLLRELQKNQKENKAAIEQLYRVLEQLAAKPAVTNQK